jgi:hypothetical protein
MFARILATALAVFVPHHGCERYVARATWAQNTLTVVPTRCGRRRSWLEPRAAFAELPAEGRSLYLQFRCHALFAAAKPAWDLEASRPVVSWSRLIATACNP